MNRQMQDRAQAWFRQLRDQILNDFEQIEIEGARNTHNTPGKFELTEWQHREGGGGTIALMRGQIFEKVGVNISTVWGHFSEEFRSQIPGTENDSSFWASGISLVAHMKSPLVPAVHMNTRHITTEKAWFGGGTDLTPYFPFDEDTQEFHQTLKEACDRHNPEYYPKYKKWCDDYFYLKHRQEARGIGGIFFDYLDSGNLEADFLFTQDVGIAFLEAYSKILRRRMFMPWSHDHRQHQLLQRGRYVEFNLLYDRGTHFGLKTGGNIDAIFMSLPPEVKW